ncbi:MAG: MBL fold metallo-hydrolase [Trueperaceae bacterium]
MSDALPSPPRDLGGGGWLLDTGLAGETAVVGVFARTLPDGSVVLIEAGSGATVPAVTRGLEALGIGPTDVTAIVVTHVHLDHAAGAGGLSAWADAPVFVHPDGATHLADPSRLWNSAARIYGDAMDILWGPMHPVPPARLHALPDGEPLQLGGADIRVLHTPGHARHHLSLIDEHGDAYVGDTAGILLPDVPRIRPALPPPETDLEAAERSCTLLADAAPQRLLLTHFGVVDDPHEHLRAVVARNRAWADAVLEGLRAGQDEGALTRRMEALEHAELDASGVRDDDARRRWKGSSDARMTVMGLSRYWRKLRPEALENGPSSGPGGSPAP